MRTHADENGPMQTMSRDGFRQSQYFFSISPHGDRIRLIDLFWKSMGSISLVG